MLSVLAAIGWSDEYEVTFADDVLSSYFGAIQATLDKCEEEVESLSSKHQSRPLARPPLEPCHAQRVDDVVARHVLAQGPSHHLAAEQIDHHRLVLAA